MKKIAMSTIKSFLKENVIGKTITKKFPIGDSEFEVIIKTALTTDEKSLFISRVLSGCFDKKRDFRPEYVTPMLRATILQVCSNIPVVTLKGDSGDNGGALMDIDAMNNLYCALDLDSLDDDAYQTMLNELVKLTSSAIDWRRSRVVADIQEEAAHAVKEVSDKIAGVIESLDMERLMEYAAVLSKQTEALDTEGLVKAILETDQRTTE